jgi:hypothetical protein
MKSMFVAILLLVAIHRLGPEQNAKTNPNSLTPKEVTDGWLLLFDGETTFGWQVEGEARVKDGVLVLGGDKETTVRANAGFDTFTARLSFRCELPPGASEPPRLSWREGDRGVTFPLSKGPGTGWGQGTLRVRADDEECELRPEMGGTASLKRDLPHRTEAGPSHLTFHVPAGGRLELRGIVLRPTELQTVFNGKDLSGWEEVKTAKTRSKFTVTPEGWLNIKDGPGDLQTRGQWADFVLQLECISNGDHLNSGVFFRCLPGKFWSGYEAQIRNQWQGDDRAKPVDYGTGGIYNRQPARKVVSSDRAWFTMTVAAEGKQLAVWIDGYQTADFSDTRTPDPSARKGSKTGRGPISLQGHDPTTDLSFRNLRIAELPAPSR